MTLVIFVCTVRMTVRIMSKAPARVLEQGRVTIPADVRRDLGLEQGDYVIVDVQPLEESDS